MPRGNDSRDHENRKVSREALWNKHIAQQQAMWQGIDAAEIASHVSELDEEYGDRVTHSQNTDIAPAHGIPRPTLPPTIDTEGDSDATSADLQEEQYWRNVHKNTNLGKHPNDDNPPPSHIKGA